MGKLAYEVLIGLNYSDKRAEIGDVIDDLPESDIGDLLELGAIAQVMPEPEAVK
jgi:hypothetical protein